MDVADAALARAVIDKYSDIDSGSACITYCKALIEYISCMLEEEGSSKEIKDAALLAGVLSYGHVLREID